jgi:hypothetical protein
MGIWYTITWYDCKSGDIINNDWLLWSQIAFISRMWVERNHQLDLQKVVSRISACFQTPLSIICLAGLDLMTPENYDGRIQKGTTISHTEITFPILLGFQMLATPVMHFFKCRHPSLWISVALVPRPKVTEFFLRMLRPRRCRTIRGSREDWTELHSSTSVGEDRSTFFKIVIVGYDVPIVTVIEIWAAWVQADSCSAFLSSQYDMFFLMRTATSRISRTTKSTRRTLGWFGCVWKWGVPVPQNNH